MVLSLYILVWILAPLVGLIAGARLGLAARWRTTLLYSAATIALSAMAYFAHDPFVLFQLSTDRAYHDTYFTVVETPNYYRVFAIVYGASGLIHAGIAFWRPTLSVLITSSQFWLMHIGVLLPVIPMGWALTHIPSFIGDETFPLFEMIARSATLLGNSMSAIAVLLLIGLLLWAIWAKSRSADRVE